MFVQQIRLIVVVAVWIGASVLASSSVASAGERYRLQFEPGDAKSTLAPRFLPKGTKIALSQRVVPGLDGVGHLEGFLPLGKRGGGKSAEQRIVLARSKRDGPYDMLFVDTDRDKMINDEQPVMTKPVERRGKIWSSFSTNVRVPHQRGSSVQYDDYDVNFWMVAETVRETPNAIRYSRRGFLAAPVQIRGQSFHVVLADGNNDGIFGDGDSWAILSAMDKSSFTAESRRDVGDFAWAAGKAWKLELKDTTGRSGSLVRINPGVTKKDDEIARDVFHADREAPRAKRAMKFRQNVSGAMSAARRSKAPYYLAFETTWCGPCKQMNELVYTAKEVVAASQGVVCIKVDGDEHKDLVKQFGVTGYPTGILFDKNGRELARFTGYQSVKQMTALFGKARL